MEEVAEEEEVAKEVEVGGGGGRMQTPGQDGQEQNSRASMLWAGTGSVHSRCKWNNPVHKRIMCSC